MKIFNYLMTACFLFSAVVQYNDPDPIRWMAIYWLAGAACVMGIMRRDRWFFPAVVGAGALVWALTLAPQVIGKVAFRELFQSFEIKDERVEVGREMGGLLIVAFWMAVLTWHSLRRRKIY